MKEKRGLITFYGIIALVLMFPFVFASPALSKEPIKIGIARGFSGVFADIGEETTKGTKIYLKIHGNKIAGRPVKLILEDTECKVDVGLMKIKKLVEKDKVDILMGITSTSVGYAVANYVDKAKVPILLTMSGGRKISHEPMRSDYIWRSSYYTGMSAFELLPYAYKKLGYRSIYFLGIDYAAGREITDAAIAAFERVGGKAYEDYWPFGTMDYAPFFTRIMSKADDIDAVWGLAWGNDSVRLIRQYTEFGLRKKKPYITMASGFHNMITAALGEDCVGITNSAPWVFDLPTPANKIFAKEFHAAYGRYPAWATSVFGYLGMEVLDKALSSINGDTSDKRKMIDAIANVNYDDGILTHIEFEKETRTIIYPEVFLARGAKINGEYVNSMVKPKVVLFKNSRPSIVPSRKK